MMTQKTGTETKYTYRTAGTLRARYHDGRPAKTGLLVHVTNHENSNEYEVLVSGDRLTCNCLGFTTHFRGTRRECVHCRGARAHLLREAAGRMLQVPAGEVAPSILTQIGTAREKPEWRKRAEREADTLW